MNWTAANSSLCSSVAEAAAASNESATTLPWLCDHVPYAATSWQGVLCHPFWGYSAMKMLPLFMLTFYIRAYARRASKKWRWQDRHEERRLEPRVGADLHSEKSRPLLGNGRPQPPSQRHGALRCFGALVGRGCACGFQAALRTVLQVLQWWLVALLIFVWLLYCEVEAFRAEFPIDLYSTFWLKEKPGEFRMIPDWLAMTALYSFVALLVIYAVAILNISLQVMTHLMEALIRGGCVGCAQGLGMVSSPRDVAIQVHLLPVVYGFLAAKSVTDMLASITETFKPALQCTHAGPTGSPEAWGTAEKRALQRDVLDSNFALADMYEAYALYCFARMVTKVLQPDLRKKIKMDVILAYESVLLIDVKAFTVICFLNAFYDILLTWCKWRLGVDVCLLQPSICSVEPYLVGANWAVSSIAIINLIHIETKFQELPNMELFRPKLKFYAIKIMVVVSFWSSLVMGFVRDMLQITDDEATLLDASVRIYVMAVVSVLNIWAWWPWSGWYDVAMASSWEARAGAIKEVGVKNVPSGTIYLVRRLLPQLSEEDANEWSTVQKTLESLGEHELYRVLYVGSQVGWAVPAADAGDLEERHSSQWSGFFGKSSANLPSHRKAMVDSSLEERRRALVDHIHSFYPDV